VSDVFGWLGKGGDLLNEGADWADQATGINSAVSCATDPSVGGCEQAAGAVTMAVAAAFTDGTTEALEPAMGTIEESADGLAEDIESDLCEGGQSFSAGTKVLLASGAAIAIDTLRPGDRVLATNTKTGKTTAETVAAVLVHHDTDLYDLTVKTSHGTEVIDTTSSHLFWDPSLHYGWIPANHLKPGMHLKTPDGQTAVVVGGSTPAVRDGWMWDLTVPGNNDHDFYVQPGATAILVHNDNPKAWCGPFFGGVNLLNAAKARAEELSGALSAAARGRVTMAVGMGVDEQGALRTVIGTSEENGYLRPGVVLYEGENLADGFADAEINVLDYMDRNNIDPWVVGATRPICPACAAAIQDSGADPATPLRGAG